MCICTPSKLAPICPKCPIVSKNNKPDLILVRGLPGSGKSTLAKLIAGTTGLHMEADIYFHRNPTGTYQFDRNKLDEAHRFCQNQTVAGLMEGKRVVVSNTFTMLKEMRPYFATALTFGIVPMVIIAQNQFQNVHNVPQYVLARMKERFQWDVSPLFRELDSNNHYEDFDGVLGT